MSLESLAKEATLRAKGDAAMVEVPEVEGVMRERRNRHRAKQAAAGAVVVVVLFGAVAAAVALRGSGGNSSHPQIATQPSGASTLEFRVVGGVVPYAYPAVAPTTVAPIKSRNGQAVFAAVMTSCANGAAVTPHNKITPTSSFIILPDKPDKNGKHQVCYVLGPRLLDGSGVSKVVVSYDSSQGGYIIDVMFDNDDFVNKVARPELNKQVAIVVDDIVESAPTINPGITGRDVQISGNFTQQEAIALAGRLGNKTTKFETKW
jgi:hypothetical protein